MDIRELTNSEQLIDHVRTISQWIRLSGDPDEAKAFDYIEARLQTWGIRYTRLTHPAYISLPGRASLSVQVGDAMFQFPCITHAMAAQTPSEGVSGPVVYVKSGSQDDFRGFPAGSVALVDGLATPERTLFANQAGASGVIYVNGNELHEMIVSPVWGSPSIERIGLLPTIPVVSILGPDGAAMKQRLERQDPVLATLRTEVLTEWRQIPLITAEIEGHDYPDEVVLLAGHVDSWHYGAMDNASANAVQLEALRIFSERQHQLKRTLRVAFWSGHSHGRYAGSTWYVDEHWEELQERLVAHVYVDSIGGRGATVLSQAWAMSETKQIAVDVLEQETGEVFEGGRFGRGGDQSFYGVGVSALFMCLSEQPPVDDPAHIGSSKLLGGNGKTSGLGSWWHAVDDTIDKLDPEFLYRDARVYLSTLQRLLENDALPFDFRRTVAELRGHLLNWQEKAGSRFDLSPALTRCEALQSAVERLYDEPPTDVQVFNARVVALGRCLVPLNYSTGNRFDHDLALGYPPIAALQPIEKLLETVPGSDADYHVLVLLKRRLNYVCHALRTAARVLEA